MNRRLPIAAILTLLAGLSLTTPTANAATGVAAARGFAPHQLVVKLADEPAPHTMRLPQTIGVREAATALRRNARVEYAAPNYIATASTTEVSPPREIPNDPGPITGPP